MARPQKPKDEDAEAQLCESVEILQAQVRDSHAVIALREAHIAKIERALNSQLQATLRLLNETRVALRSFNETRSVQFFVGIGTQKAGTTWLHDYFVDHPQVFVPPIKETHFFDTAELREYHYRQIDFLSPIREKVSLWNEHGETALSVHEADWALARLSMEKNPTDYRRYFLERVHAEHKAMGEITPSYILLEKAGFQKILNQFPNTRFIMIMRNPVDRAWSAYREIDNHIRPNLSFLEFARSENATRYVSYARTLSTLHTLVPPSDIYTTFYEHLFGDQGESEIRRLNAFLGLNFVTANFKRKSNATPAARPLPVELRRQVIPLYRDVYTFARDNWAALPSAWLVDLECLQD